MLELSKVLLIIVGTIVVFRAIRGLWIRAQVGSDVRRDLLPPQSTVLALAEERWFSQDCGSVKKAIRSSYCDRDYVVTYQESGGASRQLRIIAVFHPIVGILRQVMLHSDRWETVIDPQSEA